MTPKERGEARRLTGLWKFWEFKVIVPKKAEKKQEPRVINSELADSQENS